MNVTMNGEPISLNQELSLFELLTQHQLADKLGIAVAVNQTVIPKNNWNSTTIQNQDNILVISATKGG